VQECVELLTRYYEYPAAFWDQLSGSHRMPPETEMTLLQCHQLNSAAVVRQSVFCTKRFSIDCWVVKLKNVNSHANCKQVLGIVVTALKVD
jgi:hypothetical protein